MSKDATKTNTDANGAKLTYEVQQETWLGPHLRKAGEKVQMTAEEAKYYVPHVLQLFDETNAEPAPSEADKAKALPAPKKDKK